MLLRFIVSHRPPGDAPGDPRRQRRPQHHSIATMANSRQPAPNAATIAPTVE
ncbi:MAG: hypothetical protein P8Z80_17460 [Pseudolabrys sp.]